jgi:outer membrane protein with glycine zipper
MLSQVGCRSKPKGRISCSIISNLVKSSAFELLQLPDTKGGFMKHLATLSAVAFALVIVITGCSTPLSTREKGAGIGALGGAAAGGIIGAAVGHPGAGAAIGGALGLGAGALVGDQLQGQEQKQADQQRQIDANQAELDRQRKDLERLKRQGEY